MAKAVEVSNTSKDCLGLQNPFGHVAACADLRRYLFLHTHAGIVLAFKKYNYVDGIYGSPWVGFDNFKFLIVSNKLWPLTRNTLLYNIVFFSLGMFLAVAFAIMINELTNKVFKKICQSFMFCPTYFLGSGTGDFPGDLWL